MNLADTLSIAVRNLWRRKLRTFLTVLGVVIGATSIIIMISLGLAIEKNQREMVESMGDLRTITIHDSQSIDYRDDNIPKSKTPLLNDATIKLLKKKNHVQHVYGMKQTYFQGTMKIGRYDLWANIIGVDPQYFEDFEKEIIQGEGLKHADRYTFLIPEYMKYSLWDQKTGKSAMENPDFDFLKEKFSMSLGWDDPASGSKTKKIKAELVGVLAGQNWNIYTTIETFKLLEAEQKKLFPEYNDEKLGQKGRPISISDYSMLELRVDSFENVKALQDELRDEGYSAQSMVDFSESMKEGQLAIQAILGGIGSISFIVAAIGITNTMVMSIYERTREIGVMKVIGASISSIRNIFLVEALLIGLSGGLLGALLSLLISKGLNHFIDIGSNGMGGTNTISVVPFYLVLSGTLFSALVGLISGTYPARRATKLSAIEAIKTE